MNRKLFIEITEDGASMSSLTSIDSILFIKPIYEEVFDDKVMIDGVPTKNYAHWQKKETGIVIRLKDGNELNSNMKYSEVINLFKQEIINYKK